MSIITSPGNMKAQAIVVSIFLSILTAAAPVCLAQTTSKPQSAGSLKNNSVREAEFMDWGLGMFVHWSLDSQLGCVISHSMEYASQKYIDRYINELPKTFNPDQYDPDKWMQIAKLAGVKYMVFTAKHHNGFCMWDTKTTDFSIMNTPYGKDIVRSYVDACRRHDMKVGFYYSPEDFNFNDEHDVPARGGMEFGAIKDELIEYTKRHLDELLTNYGEIDVIFLDGGHKAELTQYVHKIAPNCLVTRGEMVTPEQKLPKRPIPGPWETCFTLGNQWQYKPTNEDYKSGSQLINMLIETRAKGGNLLINMGPMPSGIVPLQQEERFRELALWMFVNGEAIYGTRYWKVCGQDSEHLAFTTKGKTLYAIKLTQPSAPFTITATSGWQLGQVKTVRVLGSNAEVDWAMTPQGLRITPPADLGRHKYAWAFEIVTDRQQHSPNVIQHDAAKALQGTKRVDLEGHDTARASEQ